jgi:hypothetical protein
LQDVIFRFDITYISCRKDLLTGKITEKTIPLENSYELDFIIGADEPLVGFVFMHKSKYLLDVNN